MKSLKRHALTLIEMMLVIVLIGVIGGTLALNLRGALNRGKEFKTKEMKKKIEAIVNIAAIESDTNDILSNWPGLVAKSPLIKVKLTAKNEILDAWGNPFIVMHDPIQDQFVATSPYINSDGEITHPTK